MWWIISGILAIVLGASGRFVLVGTESNGALIVAGVVMIVIGIVQMIRGKGSAQKLAEQSATLLEEIKNSEPLGGPCTVTLRRDSSFVSMAVNFEIFLNGESIGMLKNGKSLTATTSSKKNFISSPQFPGFFVFEVQDSKNVDLKFKLVGKQHIEMVSGGLVL